VDVHGKRRGFWPVLVSIRCVEGVPYAGVDAGKLQRSHRSPAFVTSEQEAPCSTSLLAFWGCAVVLAHSYMSWAIDGALPELISF
jgi:hypothetical protein